MQTARTYPSPSRFRTLTDISVSCQMASVGSASMASAASSSPVRRRMTKSDRRSQLLANARRVFGELGYSGATMEEIAARSGVARSLLYEHFDSLDELYLECMHHARSELASHVMAA